MIIGVCGKSGSGKSTLARKIAINNNGIHVDIDKIGHSVLEKREVINRIGVTFGERVLKENKVDRKRLSKIVFKDKEEMKKLTSITWEYMSLDINHIINNNLDKMIVLDWILLAKTRFFNLCDKTILVDVDKDIRRDRVMRRDSIREADFMLRDNASFDYDRTIFDIVINNTNNIFEEGVSAYDKSFISRKF